MGIKDPVVGCRNYINIIQKIQNKIVKQAPKYVSNRLIHEDSGIATANEKMALHHKNTRID